MLVLRKATPQDADVIAELELLLFLEDRFNERTVRMILTKWGGLVVGHPIVGYLFWARDEDLTDILRVGVHPDHQGDGWGTEMLTKMENHPKRMLSVRKNNPGALRLYKSKGFEVVGGLESSWAMRST